MPLLVASVAGPAGFGPVLVMLTVMAAVAFAWLVRAAPADLPIDDHTIRRWLAQRASS
ncbi:MAG: hypothetical protein ACRDVM_04165 [Acidimicrobiia bacterium]